MQILHLSADFPDPVHPDKTRAVANLLGLVPDHRHIVYALHRFAGRAGTLCAFEPDRWAVTYRAPPFGLLHRVCLDRLARRIARHANQSGLIPDAVHAHKLTVEGLVGQRLARHFGVPLIVSSQGNTDLKVLRSRPDLRPACRAVWHAAAHVLPFAPWTVAELTRLLGPRDGPVTCLPCPTPADRIIAPRETGPAVRMAIRLDEHANKGAARTARAVAHAARTVPGLHLEIIGGGSDTARAALTRQIAGCPARLTGPVPHERVQDVLNGSACLVMPSRRESYGMVFAEALMAGCPVIHGAGNGIDGYFPDTAFARPAAPTEIGLARQIADMVRHQVSVKRALRSAQQSGALDLMTRPTIAARYRAVLAAAGAPILARAS